MKRNVILILLLFTLSYSFGQTNLTQTIKGKVVDVDSGSPVIGASVIIMDSNPLQGATTDVKGFFRIENVAVGRVNIQVTYVGYEPKYISNLEVNTGKEVFVGIEIQEAVTELNEIVIRAEDKQNQTLNEMSLVDIKGFSVEETKRYAGSLNDPARMAANFAGVSNSPTGNNDIVVRGNSPMGVLWRLEGIEIPNPNHFAGEGASGGPINALNSSMLANSDFLSGAFSPNYGNVSSAVLDMNLRQGNADNREYDVSAGVLGVDLTLEGPFAKDKPASYLINGRYSSLELLDNLGLVDFGGVPKYKDLSYKFHIPSKSAGTFTLFGLMGKSNISLDSAHIRESDLADIQVISRMNASLWITGLKNVIYLNNNTYLDSYISLAGNGLSSSFYNNNGSLTEYGSVDEQMKMAIRSGITFNKKLNSQNKIETGLISSRLAYDFNQTYTNNDVTTLAVDENGNAFLHQFFFSWKYRMNEKLTIVSGVHNTLFSLNKEFVPEPRLSLRWNVSAGKSLYFGTGMYSRPHSLPNYFVKTENPDGTFSTPNTDLKMTRAVHLVGGYDWSVSQNLFLNITAYYQYLYHVPVENDLTSNRSLVNLTGYFDDRDFVSEGTGRNYGLELTLERYLENHFYYLMTGSLYNSLYSALDGTEYDTRWNGNYVFNALGGKEFVFNKKEKREKTLGVNLKVSLQGGNRYNPINLAESQLQTAMIRYENPPFVERGDDIFLMNMGLSYKVNRPKSTREWKLEILNVTNHSAKIDEYYAPWTQDIVEAKQWSLLPNIIYRVQF